MKLLALTVGNTSINCPQGIPCGGLTSGNTSLTKIVTTGISFLLVLAALIALLYLILGGLKWITSGGDQAKLSSARSQITYAVIGLTIAFGAFILVSFIGHIFGAQVLK